MTCAFPLHFDRLNNQCVPCCPTDALPEDQSCCHCDADTGKLFYFLLLGLCTNDFMGINSVYINVLYYWYSLSGACINSSPAQRRRIPNGAEQLFSSESTREKSYFLTESSIVSLIMIVIGIILFSMLVTIFVLKSRIRSVHAGIRYNKLNVRKNSKRNQPKAPNLLEINNFEENKVLSDEDEITYYTRTWIIQIIQIYIA